ncbi:hypothetical protein PM082_004054 [Marasmius tenuissimus]|nr:hypothetical protein PM082_004054 [Marasmius tenuissimus]
MVDPNSLSLLRSLERIILSIRVRLTDLIQDACTSTALSKIILMFATITSPRFRTIVLHLVDSSDLEAETEAETETTPLVLSDEWNRLDDLFSTEKFAKCAVELVVPSSTSDDDLVAAGRKAFPKSHYTGRLSVVRAQLLVIDESSSEMETGDFSRRSYLKEIE